MTREALRVAASLIGPALFLGAGLGLAALSDAVWSRGRLARLAWAYLLGTAACGVGTYLLSASLSLLVTRVTVFVALCAAVGGALFRGCLPRRAEAPDRPSGGRVRLLGVCVASVAAVVCATAFLLAVSQPAVEWDGVMTWGPLARWIRAEQTVSPRALLEPQWFVTNPRHPVLAPTLAAVTRDLARDDDERAGRSVYPLFLPAFLGVLWSEARRRAGRRAAALATAAALLQPALCLAVEGGPAGSYSDFPLACFFGGGVLLLTAPGRSTFVDGALGGLLLAAATLTKSEGAALAVAALLAGAARLLLSGSLPDGRPRGLAACGRLAADARVLPAAVATGVALLLLWRWRSAIPIRFEDDYAGALGTFLHPSLVLGNLARAGPALLRRMTSLADWGLTWHLAPFAVAAGVRLARRRTAFPLALAACAPLAVAGAAYAVSPFPEGLANATCNRFLAQASLPALVLLALLVQRQASLSRALRRTRPGTIA